MELAPVLKKLKDFVYAEHEASMEQLYEIWSKPLQEKLARGETQALAHVKFIDSEHLEVTLGDNESRFREGDMLCLHLGDAHGERLIKQGLIEAENDEQWLIRAKINQEHIPLLESGCYADPDQMDMRSFYDKALEDIATSNIGRTTLLPLLAGQLDTNAIFADDFDDAADYAESQELNDKQCEAVGVGVASKYVACIQGPPGTGKTKVISIIARLLAEKGQSVLMTSHTHMAINNALNKIVEEGVPVAKVCSSGGIKSLNAKVPWFEAGLKWEEKPDKGYVIGATPFATCSERLESFDFDTIIFDEASQITLPLALMAMRKGKRFVFVGDHKQLPPVILSTSILEDNSAFSKMVTENKEVSILLGTTYRMSSALTQWPSRRYYQGNLVSKRAEDRSTFKLPNPIPKFREVLSSEHPAIFIETPALGARNSNPKEAQLVADIISSAVQAGLSSKEIGVVTPYRSHAKSLKSRLADQLGIFGSKAVVTDTVERMQGQEREMIIVSLCSSDIQYINAIAEFFFQSERLNVAITRPQTKLIIIGPRIDPNFAERFEEEKVQQSINDYCSLVEFCHHVEV